MLQKILWGAIVFQTSMPCVAQTLEPFLINGKIKYGNLRTIYLAPIIFDKKYYFAKTQDSSQIVNHAFFFNGMLPYPHPFKLYYKDTDSGIETDTEMFFVENGNQVIRVDSITEGLHITINNCASNDEFLLSYLPEMKPYGTAWEKCFDRIDSVSNHYNGKAPDSVMTLLRADEERKKYELDVFLLNYVRKHPTSYVALWKLVQKFSVLGYTPLYSQIYNCFSPALKKTPTGRELGKALKAASQTAVGKIFPNLPLTDTKNVKLNLAAAQNGKAFVLLDFWYSHCAPCIAQFQQLKTIYREFEPFGLEIICISTDSQNDEKNWLTAINKNQLPWKNFWDIGGVETKKLSINSFPTNFLLDSNGKVIQRNIDPFQLNLLLRNNFSLNSNRLSVFLKYRTDGK